MGWKREWWWDYKSVARKEIRRAGEAEGRGWAGASTLVRAIVFTVPVRAFLETGTRRRTLARVVLAVARTVIPWVVMLSAHGVFSLFRLNKYLQTATFGCRAFSVVQRDNQAMT
jgi:hypothetical protein